MPLNIQDSEGKTKVKIDDHDVKKDVVIEDGKELSYEEAAGEKEKTEEPEEGSTDEEPAKE